MYWWLGEGRRVGLMLLGKCFPWLFGGPLGRREIDGFFRTKLCPFKTSSYTL